MVKPDRDDIFALIDSLVDEFDVLVPSGSVAVSDNDTLMRLLSLKRRDQLLDGHHASLLTGLAGIASRRTMSSVSMLSPIPRDVVKKSHQKICWKPPSLTIMFSS